MPKIGYIICFACCICLFESFGADDRQKRVQRKNDQVYADTTQYTIDSLRGSDFFSRMINHNFLSAPKPQRSPEDISKLFDPFKGKVIDSISIYRYNIFTDTVKSPFVNWFYRTANRLHVITKERYIREELFFSTGDRFRSSMIGLSEYVLRNKYYLSNVLIIPQFKDDNPFSDTVNISVLTQDAWSLGLISSYRKDRDSYLTIFDNNFLGHGNRLSFTNYYRVKKRRLSTGVEIGYLHSNVLGSFFNVDYRLGIGRDKHILSVDIRKEFNVSNDYGTGLLYINKKFMEEQIDTPNDTLLPVHFSLANGWFGKSFAVNRRETNLFFTLKGEYRNYIRNPITTPEENPYYWDQKMVLGSVGIYNEKFYRGNLIYGFGNTEDIPYGYKFEFLGGRRWTQYRNDWYVGGGTSGGNLYGFGYINNSFNVGTFVRPGYKPLHTIVNYNVLFFSNLIRFSSRYHLRQFINIYYTGGFNMLNGQRETIRFHSIRSLRGLKESDMYGTSRLIISPQSVLFTPARIYGFRFAFFTYFDMGFLGNHHNVFRNQFYNVLGIGVRVNNKQSVFKTIQIRFSYAFDKSRSGKNRLVDLAVEDRLRYFRLIPQEPNVVTYE